MSPSYESVIGIKDLTNDPDRPIKWLLEKIVDVFPILINSIQVEVVFKKSNISTFFESFDALGYSSEAKVRGHEHTFALEDGKILLPHISGIVYSFFNFKNEIKDGIYIFTGLVYQKGKRGVFHQTDIWILTDDVLDLNSIAGNFSSSIIGNYGFEIKKSELPYIDDCKSLKVKGTYQELTLLKYGEVNLRTKEMFSIQKHKKLYAFGLGMDRAVALIKGFTDQNLIRSEIPWIKEQMSNLLPLRTNLKYQPISRDISVISDIDSIQILIDALYNFTADSLELVIDKVVIINKYTYDELSESIRDRLQVKSNQCNLVLRVTFSHLSRSLNKQESKHFIEQVKNYLLDELPVRVI